MEENDKHVVLPDYLSLKEYAKLKGRSRQSIYYAIEDGRLKPTYVGKDKIPFVSPDTEVDFRRMNKNKMTQTTDEPREIASYHTPLALTRLRWMMDHHPQEVLTMHQQGTIRNYLSRMAETAYDQMDLLMGNGRREDEAQEVVIAELTPDETMAPEEQLLTKSQRMEILESL